MLLVVRHADAGDKGSWTGPDSLRPLSPTGRCQAEGLVVRLQDYPIDRILSSPTLRCQQTAQPLAWDRFLDVEVVAALGVDAGPAQLRALFWNRALRDAVLCTHGETIGRLFAELVVEGLVVEGLVVESLLEGPLDWPKGSTWLLQRTEQRRVYGRFLAPLALEGLQSTGPLDSAGHDHLLGVVTDCPPSQQLVVIMRPAGSSST
jgi:phosphohistidine phosphatase SixA